MAALARLMQVGNERSHKASLANACRQRKTQRWKVMLKRLDSRIGLANSGERGCGVGVLGQVDPAQHVGEDFQRVRLRFAQGKALADGANVAISHLPPSCRKRSFCGEAFPLPRFLPVSRVGSDPSVSSRSGGTSGRFETLRL